MESNRETQVWQRVGAPPNQSQSPQELRILLQNAWERASLFRSLSGQTSRSREHIKQLQELELGNIACLKGMLAFSGHDIKISARNLPPAPARQSLIRGYYLAKKAAAEYTARSVDPEFGMVYQEMAGREAKICALVTQLLGEI